MIDSDIAADALVNLNEAKHLLANLFNINCAYITEEKLCNFFNFNDCSLNILHINCRSLNKNFQNIKNLLYPISQPLTAIAVTETWLTESTGDICQLPDYNFVSRPRLGNLGGGVGIFLNTGFEYKIRDDISLMEAHIECLFIEILQSNRSNVLIGCVYRPPNTDVVEFNAAILSILKIIDSEKSKIAFLAILI